MEINPAAGLFVATARNRAWETRFLAILSPIAYPTSSPVKRSFCPARYRHPSSVRWKLYDTAGKIVFHGGAVWLKVGLNVKGLFEKIRMRTWRFDFGYRRVEIKRCEIHSRGVFKRGREAVFLHEWVRSLDVKRLFRVLKDRTDRFLSQYNSKKHPAQNQSRILGM